jgi:dihydroorotate dehydrogenase
MFYKAIIRPILFLFDAEKVHNFVIWIISKFTFIYPFVRLIYSPKNDSTIEINGLKFRNRLGLAAGLDKNGEGIRFWDAVGFSHIEVGTVTPKPQAGNPKPRIFRLIKDKAIINRMGFNNKGADVIFKNILSAKKHIKNNLIIGINIGKNKDTPLEKAFEDYLICLEKLYDVADFFTINISSPNTEGLRELQTKEQLENLLNAITSKNNVVARKKNIELKIIFLKIAPDLSEEEINDIYNLVVKYNINGIAATNTTLSRNNLSEIAGEDGGLSGKPLNELSNNVLKILNDLNHKNINNKILLIGLGGVFNKKNYENKIHSGADLVQVYTGFIYEGLNIVKKILNK